MRRWWQSSMIALARSAWTKERVQRSRAGSALARRFVSGPSAQHGITTAQRMRVKGFRSSLFYLGEYLTARDRVEAAIAHHFDILHELEKTDLDLHLSVDPTQIGYGIDAGLARANAIKVAREIARIAPTRRGVHCLMLDMEDPSLVDATIALHDELQDQALPAALTLQAYLRRTGADLARQIARGAKLRLVKGAFAAGADIAFADQTSIEANFRALIDAMFSAEARASGSYPIVASHDSALHRHAVERARAGGWPDDAWEIELLLGVRPDAAAALVAQGLRVRLYTPFGEDWFPYAARRVGEDPRNALLLARSLLGAG